MTAFDIRPADNPPLGSSSEVGFRAHTHTHTRTAKTSRERRFTGIEHQNYPSYIGAYHGLSKRSSYSGFVSVLSDPSFLFETFFSLVFPSIIRVGAYVR